MTDGAKTSNTASSFILRWFVKRFLTTAQRRPTVMRALPVFLEGTPFLSSFRGIDYIHRYPAPLRPELHYPGHAAL
jgi:hypothetical protein